MTVSPRIGDVVEGRSARKVPRDGSALGGLLAAHLRAHQMTQGELAEVLGVDRTLVNKYLRGDRVLRDVGELRRIAGVLGLPPEDLGLLPDPDWDRSARPPYTDDDARDEAEAWRLVRRSLNRHRHELTRIAASLYDDVERVEGTQLVTRPGWMAPGPVDFAGVTELGRRGSGRVGRYRHIRSRPHQQVRGWTGHR